MKTGAAVPQREDVDDELVLKAIREAVVSGACLSAARLNPKAAGTWRSIADKHHQQATNLLEEICDRPAAAPRPCPRCGEPRGHD